MRKISRIWMRALIAAVAVCAAGPWAATAKAQGSRKDDLVLNSRGQPLAGAQIRVCANNATTTSPCTPLASIFSDVGMTQAAANPLTTDGMGNYSFYAAPGRYVIEISGPGITTKQMRDVILPADPAAPFVSGSAITAFSLTLTGGLTVAGSAAVTGALTIGGNGNVQVKAAAADGVLYVSPNGNDANDGLSPGTAMRTIYHALCSLPVGNCSTLQAGVGTLHVANNTNIGGPVTGQGIWIMGNGDPNFGSVPSGWLKWGGAVRFDCMGTQGIPQGAKFGTCGINGGDSTHPFIWLSGLGGFQTGLVFDSISTNNYPVNAVRMGINSQLNRQDETGGVVGVTFNHFACHIDTGAGATTGPGFDIGSNVYEIAITHSVLCGNQDYSGGVAADQAHAMVLNPGTGFGGYIFDLDDVLMNNGGVKFTPGTNASFFTARHIVTEGLIDSAFHFTATPSQMKAQIEDVTVADCSGICPAVQVDQSAGHGPTPDAVVAMSVFGQTQNVVGPVTVLGQYANNLQNVTSLPNLQAQAGVIDGKLAGTTDAARRLFAPVSVRFVNQANQAGVMRAHCSETVTTGVTAPDGTTGATQVACGSGQGQVAFFDQNISPTVGDWFIVGAWVRCTTNGCGQPGSQGLNINGTAQMQSFHSFDDPMPGNQEWQWHWQASKITGSGTGTSEFIFWLLPDPTHAVQYYAPILIRIAAGTISDNEAVETAVNLAPYKSSCSVADICTMQGKITVGGGGGATLTSWIPPAGGGVGRTLSSTNIINATAFTLTNPVQFSKMAVDVLTADTTAGSLCGAFADCYGWGLYDSSGNAICTVPAAALNATGAKDGTCSQGTVTAQPGMVVFAFTGTATTAAISYGYNQGTLTLLSTSSAGTTTNGALPSTISLPSLAATHEGTYTTPIILLH